ncbi:maltokinase N-terminal cap-like domain-containing protein [Streptomyces boncukensis]|uniref:Maltokinase n=1 Tax=Streptomyces boncukensis TaxID=2711219 RepID=A0A6G4X618_9ACTN|nr:maltokinase [Streptomyces boncukensis]NGO72111.1 maltokinase [Streptomyces boncukensis]
MSDSSLPLAAPGPASGAGGEPRGRALLRSLAPLLVEWLPRQRWFAGKGRPLAGFSLVAATELLPCGPGGAAVGLLHLLVRARQGAAPADTGDCYQLLLGVREALPPELAPALIGRPGSGTLRGRAVYEALHDPRLTGLLLERLRAPGRLGPLRFAREPDAVIPSGLRPSPLDAEQSNSSVVYGSSFVLKLFRRVDVGVNPDLELPLALARSGCGRVPAPTAWFETRETCEVCETHDACAEPSHAAGTRTLGVLQPFLPGATDGWQLALRALAARRDFTGPAGALGRTTAEVHAGLARALPTAALDGAQLERVAGGMAERLDAASAAVPALRPYRTALRGTFHALAEQGRRGDPRPAQRVHGDLHLGQTLRAADGRWTLIDFEGEPARPLAERRGHHPVARDIAGILRSFDYAACQRPAHGGCEPDPDACGDPFARGWAARNRAAYCAGYAAACGVDPREDAVLLRAYETDKAVYEVLYEARNRPAWLSVPLSAIRRLAAEKRSLSD